MHTTDGFFIAFCQEPVWSSPKVGCSAAIQVYGLWWLIRCDMYFLEYIILPHGCYKLEWCEKILILNRINFI